jgi:hypothetical protein
MRRLLPVLLAAAALAVAATPAAAAPGYSCGRWSDGQNTFNVVVQQGSVSCLDARAMTWWWWNAPARQVSHRWPGRFWWCYDTSDYMWRATGGEELYCRGLARSLVALYDA